MKRWTINVSIISIFLVLSIIWAQKRSPPIAAITFLVGPEQQDLDDFKISLSLYAKFAAILRRYPVFVFHEGGKVNQEQTSLTLIAKGYSLRFIEVKLGPRGGFDPLTPLWNNNTKRGGLSYYNMIRWNVVELFNRPEVSNLDFVMRLDSDSEIKSTIKEDLFVVMAIRHLVYAYKIDSFESRDFGVTDGLASFARAFIQARDLTPKNPANILNLPYDGSMPAFYNNFEIISVPFLKSALVWNFVDVIDKSDMIYRKRWGDAPIRYLIMNIFADAQKIWKINRDVFHYCHAPLCD